MARDALSDREIDELIAREDGNPAEVDWWAEHLLHPTQEPKWHSRADYRQKANKQGTW